MTEATELIKAITEIANSNKIKDIHCRNIAFPRTINENETGRVLHSYLLFQEELKKGAKNEM